MQYANKKGLSYLRPFLFGAEDEARTRDLQLGKLSLYQLSYFRRKSGRAVKPGRVAKIGGILKPANCPLRG